jgi:hypothetical protein
MRAYSAALLLLTLSLVFRPVPCALGAGERTSEHSIIGLFSPDREKDLRDMMANLPDIQLVGVDFENARATFRYDVPSLFPNQNAKAAPTPAEIEQRLNKLLTEASTGTFSVKLSQALPREKLTKIEMDIGICKCKGCRYAVYLMIMRAPGVEQVWVDENNHITAWFDPAKTDRSAIEQALKKLERK